MATAEANRGNGNGQADAAIGLRPIPVEVNGKVVLLDERVMTGLEIKQAAIAQHVEIQPDFVLQLERRNGEFDTIGDDDKVLVRRGLNFTAIAPDDNS